MSIAMSRERGAACQRGITMVEALVALVVLSVGMLGIAGLYVSSLKAGRSALVRTQAVNLVQDMADRISANARARDAYDVEASYGGAPATHDCVEDANCTPEELAEDDLARWIDSVGDTLPGSAPTADVQFTPAAAAGRPDRYTIRVDWQEPGEAAPFTYAATMQLIPVTP